MLIKEKRFITEKQMKQAIVIKINLAEVTLNHTKLIEAKNKRCPYIAVYVTVLLQKLYRSE